MAKNTETPEKPVNFIKEIINRDLAENKHGGKVATRFPPEPNGYLHIGHAKSICLNFGIAKEYGGTCNLRFDDTNPVKEDIEYVDSIQEDIRWLGFQWEGDKRYASDYFEKLYEIAEQLIRDGLAYVCSLNEEQSREYRGNYYKKAKPSPYRDRSVEENLDLFRRMKDGEFKDGEHVLRAKVDLESQNMNLRDPVLYRIKHAEHHRTGDTWCIYPMYDFAHGLSDAFEGITHSICTLEFQDHRPLYDWFNEKAGFEEPPHQYEFARLNLNYTVMSKRKLLELVENKHVSGWNDPRMPTISGLRRRGYTPESVRNFADRIGVAKNDSVVDVALLEHCIREDLNEKAPRVMGVLNPLKVVIENYPEGESETFEAPFHPQKPEMGSRSIPFGREIYIERDDFMEEAPKKWFRLAPGKEVRLRYACLIQCTDVIKDDNGEVIELRCTWDPESRGGTSPDGRKVKGTLHWVSAEHAFPAEVRLYDRLFRVENPMDKKAYPDFKETLNEDSLTVIENALLEPSLAQAKPGDRVQFERLGYFCVDTVDSSDGKPVFNRTVSLRDSWAKIAKKTESPAPKATKKDKSAKNQKKAVKAAEDTPSEIEFDDFVKLDLRVGIVKEAERVEEARKLLRLMVDIGEERPRQIFAGIQKHYPEPGVLVGKPVIVVANLKPRKMRFGVSEGMVLAGSDDASVLVATFDGPLKPGGKVS